MRTIEATDSTDTSDSVDPTADELAAALADLPTASDKLDAIEADDSDTTDGGPIDQDDSDDTPAVPVVAIDPRQTFRDAYGDAIDAADPATGTVPAVQLDGVLTALRAVPAAQRGQLVAELAAGVKLVSSDGVPDMGAIGAMQGIAVAISTAPTGRAPRPTRDPLDVAAEQYGLLVVATAHVLDGIDVADRATVIGKADALDASDALTARLARVLKASAAGTGNGGSGEKVGRGVGGARIDHGAHVLDVLTLADGPLTLAAIKATGSEHAPDGTGKSGATDNAVGRLVTAGTVAIDGGTVAMVDGTAKFTADSDTAPTFTLS